MNEDNLNDMPPVPEATVKFNAISDRSVYKVVSEKNEDITLIEITGYDLQINFNMQYLKSLEDVNAASQAIGILFRDIILEKLLDYKTKDEETDYS